MDLAWLAVIGVLLLVAGLSALGYDTVRRRHSSRPFPFPDSATQLIDETALNTPTNSQAAAPPPTPNPQPPTPAKPRRALVLALVPLAIGIGIAAAIMRGQAYSSPKGSIVVGVCRFMNAPAKSEPTDLLIAELSGAAASTGLPNIVIFSSQERPASPQQAEAERARLKADFVVWGEVNQDGHITSYITLAPDFSLGAQAWQQWTDRNPQTLALPRQSQLQLDGIYPLVPMAVALVEARAGDYAGAARAAGGAQATLDQANGTGRLASLIEAAARAAEGKYDTAAQLLSDLESKGDMPAEGYVNRGLARLQIADYTGARADLDRAIADRGASDRTRARAHLLKARALYRPAGDLASALVALEESARLDPDFAYTRLDKAEVLYRQAEPVAAQAELRSLLKIAPDSAPAHRLMGLTWLMLGKPEEAQKSLAQSHDVYSHWTGLLRAEEGKAQVTGDLIAGHAATEGILLLNRELAGVYLYTGMAQADQARKQPPESFLGGLWRFVRNEPTTYERAIASMQEAARLDPRRPDVLLQMGNAYADSGDSAQAAQALQRAWALDPTAPGPYMTLARLQETQGNPAEAVKTLNQLLEHVPQTYEAYQKLYDIYTKLQDAKSASAALERALAAPPRSPSDHLWRGKFLRLLGKNEDAAAELQAATEDPMLGEAHLLLGQILLEGGHRPEALERFQAALSTRPNDPDALLNAGRLLVLAGQTEEAETLLARLAAEHPGNVDGHIAYLELLAGKSRLDKAIDEGKRAVQADGRRSDAYYALGRVYEAQKNWPQASTQYKAATERDQSYFDAFIRLVVTLFREDKYAESVRMSDEAIKLRGDDPQTYRWKAESQLALGEPDQALQSLGEALRLSPQFADALALTARAYSMKGDATSAIAYANKAASAEPHNPAGMLALGDAYLAMGDPNLALQALNSASTTAPGPAESLAGQGRAYNALGDKDKALKLYAEAAAAGGQYAPAHLYTGHTYVELARWDDAFREYSKAVQIRPNWPEALYHLGRAYLQRKDLSNAQRYFDAATKGAPNLAGAWFGLGIADRDQGRRAEAIAALSRATQLNGNYSDAWLYLGLTYEESGEHKLAADAFDRARITANDPAVKQQAEQGLARVR